MKLLCTSKNRIQVFYDPLRSHAATHFNDAPTLKELVVSVIADLDLTGQEIAQQFDMGKVIGTCDVVAVDETDEIVYGMRRNREDDGLVPFVKTRQPSPCSTLAMHLIPQPDGTYILSSAWIGPFGDDDQPFPQSPQATDRSAEYWNKWAFVYGSQEVIEGTETSVRPW